MKSIIPRKTTFKCQDCHKELQRNSSGGTGYALYSGKKICYDCAKKRELKQISKVPLGGRYDFYWDGKKVTNWTGLISFTATGYSKGRHNIGGTREDVWFKDNLGHNWHGVQIGQNTMILRAKRVK